MALPSNTKRKIFDGRYEIISIVGRGADSVVYHARHVSGSAQEVALKVLVNRKGRSSLSDRLRKEALTLVSCRHKYVVRLDDFHSIEDLCYLSMEFAPLGDLAKYVATHSNKISIAQAQTFLRQALEALDFIHATGVIHRDLKPENILVVSETEIRLADFGLALLPGDELRPEDLQNGVGTLDYLAPEVLEGIRYDSRSDLYSLGVLFYELLAGKHPFSDAPIAEQLDVRLDSRVASLEKLLPELPPHVAAVIAMLTRFDANNRFQSASEALDALRDEQFRLSEKPLSLELVAQPAVHKGTSAVSESFTSSAASVATAAIEPITASASETALAPFDEPANSDPPPDRAPQPTEKIDLERIKAIIAKDTARRSFADQEETSAISESATTPTTRSSSRTARAKTPKKPTAAPFGASKDSHLKRAVQFLVQLPLPARLASVAAISALITIVVLLILPIVVPTSGGNNRSAPPPQTLSPRASDGEDASAKKTESPPKEATFVSSLGEGIYSGTLEGLIPNTDTPLLLVSIPTSRKLVLILGMEGWIPAEASTVTEDGSPIESPTFRSNGLILRFNGELSSGEIIGTFTDVLTGESGIWNVKQAS